ncbi:FAD-dependent oxidoreductase [Nodosilinea sp. LEGE 07088]|uniref:FAD-dependent oxidoreductase n=1 Tax=Nodosilinea sp. LEGE 07088 TaxID=2777968 RepID=UPI0028BE3816|nr:FAD-dependent oxidoreductase [Nodosilinea sp. LEGE 07088]
MKGNFRPAQPHIHWHRLSGLVVIMFGIGAIAGLGASRWSAEPLPETSIPLSSTLGPSRLPQPLLLNGRPHLDPLPKFEEVWHCQVAVISGSLGGVAAAAHAMATGATTCLIEVSPWLGGQISSQGVSALDESRRMRQANNLSPSWQRFHQLVKQQVVELPAWSPSGRSRSVADINSCWVGRLCFPPQAGAQAAEQLLSDTRPSAPESRWRTIVPPPWA